MSENGALTSYILCPRCERAWEGGGDKAQLHCPACGYEWLPPLHQLKDIYRARLDELVLRVSAQNGESCEFSEWPALLGRDSEFLALQQNGFVSRRHCEINYDSEKRSLILFPLKAAGGTYLNRARLEELVEYPLRLDDDLSLGGVALKVELCLRQQMPTSVITAGTQPRELLLQGKGALSCVCVSEQGELFCSSQYTPGALLLFSRNKETAKWSVLALRRRDVRLNGGAFVARELHGGEILQIGGTSYSFFSLQGKLSQLDDIQGCDIDVHHLQAGYEGRTILRDVSCHIPSGQLTAILGQSGCGKSTFIKILAGLKLPVSGKVAVGNTEDYLVWAQENQVLVPQFSVAQPELTVKQCVEFAADLRLNQKASRIQSKRDMVNRALRETGLTHLASARVGELSGGQNKRVNIAMEIVGSPQFIILDEPTTGLDYATEQQIIGVLRQMSRLGRTVLFVTHSLAALEAVDHVIVLRQSQGGAVVAAEGPPSVVRQTIGVESWEELFLRMDKERKVEVPALSVSARKPVQMLALLMRYMSQWKNSAVTSLFLLFVLPVMLGLLITAAVSIDSKDAILFALVAMFWLSMNQSVREIVKEKDIFLHERAQSVTSGAYLGSRCAFFSAVTLLQACLLYLPLALIRPNSVEDLLSPGWLGCSSLSFVPMLWLAGLLGTGMGLLGSALALFLRRQGEVAAVLFAVVCTLPQILFSNKIIPSGLANVTEQYYSWSLSHAATAPVAEFCSFFTISRYLYLPLEVLIKNPSPDLIVKAFAFNVGVLVMVLSCLVCAIYVLLELYVWRARR